MPPAPGTAGVVLWRRAGESAREVATVYTAGGPALPARPTGGAAALVTALRVARRTGTDLGPPGPPLRTGDPSRARGVYWPVEAVGDTSAVDGVSWVPVDEAVQTLVGRGDKRIIRAFLRDTLPRRQVVIVRHARAGKRSGWTGRDEDRPLDRRGRAQAQALGNLLVSYRIARIHSSDARRCTETVAPLADALALPVHEDPLLGERGAADDPERARELLLDLVRRPGQAAICGQRKSLDLTLPGVLDALGVGSRPRVPRKGGLLVLHVPTGHGPVTVEAVDPPI